MTQVRPDELTINSVLNACAHGGLVSHAVHVYLSMEEQYNISAGIPQQGCIVDAFSRIGMLDKAQEFMDYEVLRPDVVMWRSFLTGCKTFFDVPRAEYAAKKVLAQDPTCRTTYRALATLYLTVYQNFTLFFVIVGRQGWSNNTYFIHLQKFLF